MRISDWSSDVCSSDLQTAVLHLAGGQHDETAIGGGDLARVADDCGARRVAGGDVIAGHEVVVADRLRRCDQGPDVDPRVRTEHDAVRIDEEHADVRRDIAENLRGIAADDAVQNSRGSRRLIEYDVFGGAD